MKVKFASSLVAAALLAACSGGSHAPSPIPVPQQPGSGTTPALASSFAYNTAALQGATFVGPAKVSSSISVDLVPRLQNGAGLLQYAQSVSDTRSGSYRHFLTPQEIGDRYGASPSSYADAVKYFQAAGLTVGTWPQRLLLHVSGSQADMQAALHTTFGWYRSGTSVFLAPTSAPAPPASANVIGAANIVMRRTNVTNYVALTTSAGNGEAFGYSPEQIAEAFDYTGAYAAGYTGAGVTTGVIGTGGLSAADVPAYKHMFGVGGSGTVTLVSATDADAPGNSALGFASPPPITAPCYGGTSMQPSPKCNPEDVETQLDTEQIASLAPDANLRYYLAYNPNDGCGTVGANCQPGTGYALQGLYEADAELETAIADDRADVLSLSWGGPETLNVGSSFNASAHGITPLEIAALASEGIAVFVSSGDSGAQGCLPYNGLAPDPDALCVQYPSTDPNVVSVGGVNTPLNSAGQFVGGLTGWGIHSGGFYGSGGGVSAYFPLSTYQQGAAGISGSMRNVPDIALEGDGLTGVAVLVNAAFPGSTQVEPVGGTSVAAPEAAAMWALVLQACKQSASCATASGPVPYRLGNPAAYFYKTYASATAYASTFYDVLYGDNATDCQPNFSAASPTPCPSATNAGYSAGQGYDLVTGIGVPFARALIKTVVGK